MALLVMTQLIHSSLRRNAVTQKRMSAALFCQDKLEEIRIWARDPDNFHGDWAVYDNQIFSHPDFPGMELRTQVVQRDLASPTELWEQAHPPADRRILVEGSRTVDVDCSWDTGPKDRIELSTLVTAPPTVFHPTNPLVISGTPATPIPQDGTATFTVQAFDSANREIKGLTFSWYILAQSGNGVVAAESRDGREGTLGHWTYDIDGVTRLYVPGPCEFGVRARYNGQVVTTSVPVELQ